MADLEDVESALVTLIATIVYPTGNTNPSITAAGIRVYSGWPAQAQLDKDLIDGIAHVSVYPRIEERNTTRFTPAWQQSGSTTIEKEIRRQERLFQITVWTSTPDIRKTISSAIDGILAGTAFLTLADGTLGRIRYRGSPVTDGLQKAKLYRRDLLYTVEYATTQSTSATAVTEIDIDLTVNQETTTNIHVTS